MHARTCERWCRKKEQRSISSTHMQRADPKERIVDLQNLDPTASGAGRPEKEHGRGTAAPAVQRKSKSLN